MTNWIIFDPTIQNYIIEYYHNWRQWEFHGSIKEDKGNVVGYITGTVDPLVKLRVSLKDLQNLSIIEVFKKFGLFHNDFQITDSTNSSIGYFKSKTLHWNSFLLKGPNMNDLIKIEFKKDQMLVKSLSGKTLAKYLFEEIEKPKIKRIERIVGSNPTHHSCLISILDLSVEKKYVFI